MSAQAEEESRCETATARGGLKTTRTIRPIPMKCARGISTNKREKTLWDMTVTGLPFATYRYAAARRAR